MALIDAPPSPAVLRVIAAVTERGATHTIVWLRGDHDASTVADVSAEVARAIALDDRDVVIDLSGVGHLSEPSLQVLCRAGAFVRGRARVLTLRAPSDDARVVMGLAGLAAS